MKLCELDRDNPTISRKLEELKQFTEEASIPRKERKRTLEEILDDQDSIHYYLTGYIWALFHHGHISNEDRRMLLDELYERQHGAEPKKGP